MERVGGGIEVLRLQADGAPAQDDDRVLVYETGSVGNADEIRRAAAERGGITRNVLSHAHADYRGGASRVARTAGRLLLIRSLGPGVCGARGTGRLAQKDECKNAEITHVKRFDARRERILSYASGVVDELLGTKESTPRT